MPVEISNLGLIPPEVRAVDIPAYLGTDARLPALRNVLAA